MFLFYLFWAIFFFIWIQPKKGLVSYSFEDKIFATIGIFNLVFLSPLPRDLLSFFSKATIFVLIAVMFLCFDYFALNYIIRLTRKQIELNKKEVIFLSIFYFVIFYISPQILSLLNIS
ncbi:MAG: hypothetical protein FJZ11_07565 [Candidatus Omnitrophica bacterium]|nr:hypothetical protein [Candidatus Omnitrophota bacterium]